MEIRFVIDIIETFHLPEAPRRFGTIIGALRIYFKDISFLLEVPIASPLSRNRKNAHISNSSILT